LEAVIRLFNARHTLALVTVYILILKVGTNIKIGAPNAGNNDKIYLVVKRPQVMNWVMEILSFVLMCYCLCF